MDTQAELQDLLRFLSRDAKIPLASAMGKIKGLRNAGLTRQDIFADEKLSKQVWNAAKRVSKKRSAADAPSASSPSPTKRKKTDISLPDPSASTEIEQSLELPSREINDGLSNVVLFTNRAPLVLAFAVVLLKYTMPSQPLSSRLSLAQAVVGANSRSKAASLGLEKGRSAEEEGWGQGQPSVKVMGREVRVLRRWGYEDDNSLQSADGNMTITDGSAEATCPDKETEPALWGLDLEALRRSNTSQPSNTDSRTPGGLPIYTAHSARSYLLKSFATASPSTDSSNSQPKKKSAAALAAEKEHNLGLLLGALDSLYSSWSHALTKEELDRRAWAWYMNVRPEVEAGVAGWGGKGEVKLADILTLRRKG
ncbi:hypothetical protein GP486_006770 [Trichoglossum hirsutum]|uniref:Uncharacterized protein n=1 Tax=Trichoglossum hirsutum TaxID=265104 RepID=A0A9P8L5C3_9PEZI|nr:hypothetical protein GP486_006770 [Trichoglossum hirsutum]